jgi:thioredoxin-like negative regulator of GroEL
MIPLQTQSQFEGLLNKEDKENKGAVIVYFTASWCGACKRLDHDAIKASKTDVRWYKCDVDENKYTLGYCGLKSIPSFAFIQDGKFLGKFSSSDTEMVINMIQDSF